jgi:hypothetical protein
MAGKGWQLPSPAMHFFIAKIPQFFHYQQRAASKNKKPAPHFTRHRLFCLF